MMPKFLADLGFPRKFKNAQELMELGFYRVEEGMVELGDVLSKFEPTFPFYADEDRVFVEGDASIGNQSVKNWTWNGKTYVFRVGIPAKRKLDINRHFSEPLPLP
jgi:hypothetical protein